MTTTILADNILGLDIIENMYQHCKNSGIITSYYKFYNFEDINHPRNQDANAFKDWLLSEYGATIFKNNKKTYMRVDDPQVRMVILLTYG